MNADAGSGKRAEVARAIAASAVDRKQPRFMWHTIAYGTVCVIGGHPGIGKSMMTTAIAAAVSATGNVIMLAVEDDQAEVRARLEAAGADLDRVFFPNKEFAFPGDETELSKLVLQNRPP